MCRRCGKEALAGKTRCTKCHADQLRYSKTAKEKAIQNGLCRSCGTQPHMKNGSLCERCLEKGQTREKQKKIFLGVMRPSFALHPMFHEDRTLPMDK